MLIALRFVLFATLIGAVTVAFFKPGYESYVGVGLALSALIAEFVIRKSNQGSVKMNQKIGKHGKGLQAGGNITIKK